MNQQQFIEQKRKVIRGELAEFLFENKSDLTSDAVIEKVRDDDNDEDFEEYVRMLASDNPDMEIAQEIMMDLFNYFPRMTLQGKSLAEKMTFEELQKMEKAMQGFKDGTGTGGYEYTLRDENSKGLSSADKVLEYSSKKSEKRTKKLTKRQCDQLWGETGPYSQAQLIFETRILDDKVTRTFLIVEVNINPFTFELIQKHRTAFKDDEQVLQLLDHADYQGQAYGYVSSVFQEEYNDESVLLDAQRHLDYSRETIIRMHRFVLDYLSKV